MGDSVNGNGQRGYMGLTGGVVTDGWYDAHLAGAAALRAQLARVQAPRAVPLAPSKRFMGRFLAAPLVWKLVGANGFLVLAAMLAIMIEPGRHVFPVLFLALVASIGLNHLLVKLALRPLGDLERTATRVWQGDLDARVVPSPIADRDMVRVGSTLNLLLDGLTADRARMRLLATQIINAQDVERARIARELHDSTAQTLAAAMLQISAGLRQADGNAALAERLQELRSLVETAMEEVRTMSHTIHPRVLDDLGIVAGLEWLARTSRQGETPDIVVEARDGAEDIPLAAASVLYRVAQESVRNAVQHAGAGEIRILLDSDEDVATLTVIDDGRGFDVESAEARRPGMGLFSIRERMALVNGTVDIQSVAGQGTRITATVPLAALRST